MISNTNRINKIKNKLKEFNIDAILILNIENIRYACGFTGSTGWLLISANKAYLAVDFRYIEQAKIETSGVEILHVKGGITEWLPPLLIDSNYKNIAFESEYISFSTYQIIKEKLKKHAYGFTLIPVTNVVESLRAIKEPRELDFIASAAKIVDKTYDYLLSIIEPGMTEKQLAWEIESYLREHGSEPVPFDIIVASGKNSALPHAKPTEKNIAENELILIDFGSKISGYCSDFSRTIYLGKPDKSINKIYDIVLAAHLTAVSLIEPNFTGHQADVIARTIIEEAEYGNYFGHGLGHGVGLMVHELPRIGPNSSDIIQENMVFTIEPGIYINGIGGVRIEDTFTVKNGKLESLNNTNKLLTII